jgi:hypothetical protein
MAASSASFAARVTSTSRPFLAIAVAGFVVGALDLTYAILVYSPQNPILIPQTIASGVLGAKSFNSGAKSAALGVILHFIIALGAASVYYVASRKLQFLLDHAIRSGMIYGGLVYVFMHFIVLPLSAVPQLEMPLIYKLCEFVEHWFCVGLPIAVSVQHYSPIPHRSLGS